MYGKLAAEVNFNGKNPLSAGAALDLSVEGITNVPVASPASRVPTTNEKCARWGWEDAWLSLSTSLIRERYIRSPKMNEATDRKFSGLDSSRVERMKMKEWVVRLARAAWREIRHKDDATDEEKGGLVGEARMSPPMSRMYALRHPFLMMRAYRQIKRYQGKTWAWPRFAWAVFLAICCAYVTDLGGELLARAITSEEKITALVSVSITSLVGVLFSYYLTTVAICLAETCVWCHVVHRDKNGSVKAILSVWAYKLPFLDTSRTDASPWARGTGTYWKSSGTVVTLETRKDVSRLNFADLYDETVCWVRPATFIPPSAKRYVVAKTQRYGDTIIRERRGLDLGSGPHPRVVIIVAIIAAIGSIGQFIFSLVFASRLAS